MKKKRFDTTDIAIIKSISLILVFAAAVLIFIIALYLGTTKGEFLSAFKLDYKFYLSAIFGIVAFSLVSAPFSFGISNYIIKSAREGAKFSDVFYLFKTPKLLFKSVALISLIRIIVSLSRLAVILSALILECAIFVVSVILSGSNIFNYEQNFFVSVAEFASASKPFMIFTVLGWTFVLLIVFYIRIKYIFCKYVMIVNPLVGALEALRIGRFCICGNELRTAFLYIKYIAVYIFTFVSAARLGENKDTFSDYAVKTVSIGMQKYFDSINL